MLQMADVTILPYKGVRPTISQSTFLASGVRLTGDISIGEYSSLWFNVAARGDVNYIRVGDGTNIQDNSVVHVTTDGHPTVIGHRVTVGHKAMLHACTIEDECLIGMGAIILDGAVIRKHSFVAAGAVVPPGKTYPAGSLIIGSPAVAKREVREDELEYIRFSAEHYINIASQYTEEASS